MLGASWALRGTVTLPSPGPAPSTSCAARAAVAASQVVCPFEPFKAWYTIDVLAYTRRDGSYWAPIKVLH